MHLHDVVPDPPGFWWAGAEARGGLELALAQINSAENGPDDVGRCTALFDALHVLLDTYRQATRQRDLTDSDALAAVLTPALQENLPQASAEWRSSASPPAVIAPLVQAVLYALLDCPNTRLAAYGTLAPGQSNHALLANVPGAWLDGTVPGTRFMAGGYPAFRWRVGTDRVPVNMLASAELPAHWSRLDDFEGRDYRRILVVVKLSGGTTQVAYLYEYIGKLEKRP